MKPVCRRILPVLALVWALAGVGCRDRGPQPQSAETDEPYYLQGIQLEKQGRNSEALNAFLKVIDRRGENPAPESHLRVGLIYLNHIKDPVAACYHFRRYLKAHPNSTQSPYVLGMVEAAKREFARTLPGRPLEDQSVRLAVEEEVGSLRRQNEELRAELAVLRGGGAVPVSRLPRMITLPPEMLTASTTPPPPPVAAVVGAPVTRAPVQPAAPQVSSPVIQRAPPTTVSQPRAGGALAAAKSASPAGRTHTIAPKDTLYGIARRYNVKVEDLVAANSAVVPRANSPLRVGAVLKIP